MSVLGFARAAANKVTDAASAYRASYTAYRQDGSMRWFFNTVLGAVGGWSYGAVFLPNEGLRNFCVFDSAMLGGLLGFSGPGFPVAAVMYGGLRVGGVAYNDHVKEIEEAARRAKKEAARQAEIAARRAKAEEKCNA